MRRSAGRSQFRPEIGAQGSESVENSVRPARILAAKPDPEPARPRPARDPIIGFVANSLGSTSEPRAPISRRTSERPLVTHPKHMSTARA